ncbi:MAG TPA: thioredoxin [Flavobacteriales bacterium]
METERTRTFNDYVQGEKPVLVDFFATWCGPCKAMTPIIDDLKHRLGETAHVLKVDVDRNPQAAEALGVQGVPTLIVFKQGRVVWRRSGVVAADELERVLRQHGE